jgi:hypothetical protein
LDKVDETLRERITTGASLKLSGEQLVSLGESQKAETNEEWLPITMNSSNARLVKSLDNQLLICSKLWIIKKEIFLFRCPEFGPIIDITT